MKRIIFAGRLEKEKGAETLIAIIAESIRLQKPYHYHIFGEGSYAQKIQNFNNNYVHYYGKVSQKKLFSHFRDDDIFLMPSEFLETFGLSALEAIHKNMIVIGIAKGGPIHFIHPENALNENNPVKSFFSIMETSHFKNVDVTRFSLEVWRENLKNLTKNHKNILLVHDYFDSIGGAEAYVFHLEKELKRLGKEVFRFSLDKKMSKFSRIFYMFFSIFNISNGKKIQKILDNNAIDLVWSHSVLRFIGPHAMKIIQKNQIPHYMTHHDLGLVTPFPSRVRRIKDIPAGPELGQWMFASRGFLDIFSIAFKWIMASLIWKSIPKNTLHLLPSDWMQSIFERYVDSKNIQIFEHTVFDEK